VTSDKATYLKGFMIKNFTNAQFQFLYLQRHLLWMCLSVFGITTLAISMCTTMGGKLKC